MKNKKTNNLDLIAIHFKHELKSIFSDRGALLILVGAMIIYPVIYSIGYLNEVLTELPIVIVDNDNTPASRKYISMLDASSDLKVDYKVSSLKEAKQLILNNKANGGILIPAGFQEEIYSGNQTNIAIYADASYFLKYRNELMALTYTNAYFGGSISVKGYMAEGKIFKQAIANANPLDIQTHVLYNPSASYGSFIMPGLILIIIQQTLLIGIGVLGGSFSESKVSPFILPPGKRRFEILPYLLGKSGAYLFISFFNVLFAVFLVQSWFNYPDKADAFEIFMLLFPYLLSTIFLGIGLSTLFQHRESAIAFMVFLSPIALFFSGLSWPVSAMPDWIVSISQLMPSTKVVSAYLRLRTMGVGISGVKNDVIALYGQAIIYFMLVLAYFLIRTGGKQTKIIRLKSAIKLN